MKVRLTESAVIDLRQINAYIAADSPDQARRFVKKLMSACEGLADMPSRGRAFPELGAHVRGIPFAAYVILYRIRDREVLVLRVVHGSRDLPALEISEK